jgi:serine/threonine-protein kinase
MLGENEKNYKDLYLSEIIHNYKIYISYNIKEKRNVTLKVIKKKDYNDQNLLLKNIQNEQTILNQCKYKNIINFYRYFETDQNFIIEQEFYNINLREYLMNYGPLNYKRNFFKEIVINISKALQILYREGIIHRNIRPSSMFLVDKEKNEIKLGEFGKAIFKKDNKSEPLNSIFYTAPEIINGYEYDEKCDLWSFGVSLYELYFGFFPYGKTKSRFYVAKIYI